MKLRLYVDLEEGYISIIDEEQKPNCSLWTTSDNIIMEFEERDRHNPQQAKLGKILLKGLDFSDFEFIFTDKNGAIAKHHIIKRGE
jgi:hypothetical protein